MSIAEIIITIIGVIGSLIAINEWVLKKYNKFKRKSLVQLMNELADKNTTHKRQIQILHKIQSVLIVSGVIISTEYINAFNSDGRGKFYIFRDICKQNNIEPTREFCIQMLGSDDIQFRREWANGHIDSKAESMPPRTPTKNNENIFGKNETESDQIVYMSSLLASKYPEICGRLTDILKKHNISFDFLKGTKDIWCRDYMPVQTPNGKLIQFKYDPSYLKDSKYSEIRSDVRYVDELNHISPIFSDINLDGGNVVMFGNKAIITDRIFSENPGWSEENLTAELSRLLECEIVIIPAYKPEYDFTGHADGMMRFVDSDTVIVNNLDQDYKYMRENIVKALAEANLKYINFPWFEYKIKGNTEHAIGIYLNYLEVGNIIVMPVFGVPGNKDEKALAKLKEVFPDKIIETIDYNEVALDGGILNCSTWIIRK